jgi:excisionase family DNA binding protein
MPRLVVKSSASRHGGSELLTPVEAARYLRVKPQTLATWRLARVYPRLRYVRVGRLIRYRKGDLDEWLDARTVGISPNTRP